MEAVIPICLNYYNNQVFCVKSIIVSFSNGRSQ
jgi:hypothetical protein